MAPLIHHALGHDPERPRGELPLPLNKVTNDLIAEEIAIDDGAFLPIRGGK